MEQLQEQVKKEIIRHPTRNIDIEYEPGKTTFTAQDEEFLAAYIRLHDFEFEMYQTANKLYNEFLPVNKTLDALRDELTKAEATFNDSCSLADKLSDASYDVEETSLEKLAESQMQTEKELVNYSEKIKKVYETLQKLATEITKYNEANEGDIEAIYDKFSSIRVAHSANWQINTINIAAFEDEFEKFHSYRNVYEKRRETLMEFCDSTLDNYSKLNQQSTTLYNLWKEFLKRCKLLRAVAELHSQTIIISNN
ncbi:hypothetical protein FW778_17425 [Ginsengibacter hankyongi]|uniref:Uncharacterized protein n=1 Tax=Ginsengibacter hankyongi TaxID=2607284 RepID=A0A5J5IED1_9BACT|nr:hypothetical protein [Ginsengibacter hankyongi]KAA9037208.1 hypothetical protein FW778_17425 [Ginsengibacter hankyongi]